MTNEHGQLTNPEQDKVIAAAVEDQERRVQTFAGTLGSLPPRSVEEFRSIGFVTEGLTETQDVTADEEPIATSFPGGWSAAFETTPMSAEAEALLFGPPSLGTIVGDWPCPRCGTTIPMRCPIDRIERIVTAKGAVRRMEATVENADELRAHMLDEHGVGSDATVPLTIRVDVNL